MAPKHDGLDPPRFDLYRCVGNDLIILNHKTSPQLMIIE